jgi:transposase
MIDWPLHSPDVSPIEMVWSIIRRKIKGKRFRTAYELFSALASDPLHVPKEPTEVEMCK